MFKNTINWGSVILGAALVTGVTAAIAFLPGMVGTAMNGGNLEVGAKVGADVIEKGATRIGEFLANGAGGIADAISEAATWIGKHWGISLASGAVVGAATGLIASNATNQEDIVIDR